VAYDEELADRLREQLAGEPFTEQRMFGGLAFLLGGHMTVAASGSGGLLARVAPDDAEALASPHAEPMVMRGRAMTGWVRVAGAGIASDADLAAWVRRSRAYVATLPPKG
jgi:TfoX-like protein